MGKKKTCEKKKKKSFFYGAESCAPLDMECSLPILRYHNPKFITVEQISNSVAPKLVFCCRVKFVT